MPRILVAEDDGNQRRMMCAFLQLNGYLACGAADGVEALERLSESKIDLAICDIMMPRMDGYQLLEQLRLYDKHLPILMVTAKGDFSDKQLAFLAGADDYMVKPVDLDEMLLRVKALLRRANIQAERVIRVGRTALDGVAWTLTVGEETRRLPKKEFALLYMLLSHSGQLLTRRQLMDEVWGVACETDERTVDVHIRRLRERLADVSDFAIVTERGLGYRAEVRHG